MLGFAALMLVGGILTVLPLPFLPFVPEQSSYHYVSHAVYALAQLPLLAVSTARLLSTGDPRPAP